MDFDRSVFAPAFAAAGMWIPIRVTSDESPQVVTDVYADFHAPDSLMLGAHQSNEYEIEYQADELPDLAEGDTVDKLDADGDPIAGQSYRVRQEPYVTDNPADDRTGYFKRALLTKL